MYTRSTLEIFADLTAIYLIEHPRTLNVSAYTEFTRYSEPRVG